MYWRIFCTALGTRVPFRCIICSRVSAVIVSYLTRIYFPNFSSAPRSVTWSPISMGGACRKEKLSIGGVRRWHGETPVAAVISAVPLAYIAGTYSSLISYLNMSDNPMFFQACICRIKWFNGEQQGGKTMA